MDPFGFVILVAILSVIFMIYLMAQVGKARAKYGIPAPDQYTNDPDKKVFNCYQRAYANTNDNYAIFLLLLFAGGNIFPTVSAVAGLIWIFGKFLYAQGYYTGKPENRIRGWPAYIGLLTLLICSLINALNRIGIVNV